MEVLWSKKTCLSRQTNANKDQQRLYNSKNSSTLIQQSFYSKSHVRLFPWQRKVTLIQKQYLCVTSVLFFYQKWLWEASQKKKKEEIETCLSSSMTGRSGWLQEASFKSFPRMLQSFNNKAILTRQGPVIEEVLSIPQGDIKKNPLHHHLPSSSSSSLVITQQSKRESFITNEETVVSRQQSL